METKAYLPLPTRLYNREIGVFSNTKATAKPTSLLNNFSDLSVKTLQSLETESFLSLKVNNASSPHFAPIPIYSMEKVDDRLVISDESGTVHIVQKWFKNNFQNLSKYPYSIKSFNVSEKSAIYSLKCISGKLLTGAGSGAFSIFDLTTTDLLREYYCHDKSVKKVDSLNGDIIVTCSRDNSINVHDLRVKSNDPVNIIRDAHSLPQQESGSRSSRSKSLPCSSSSANSVTDVVFIDEHNLISSGAADGILKQWDLRVTYKHMKKFHPVTVLEYPEGCSSKGYSCLKVSGSKLYASSVHNEIFQFELGTMTYETTYLSPSKLSYYTRLDISHDSNYLSTGSEENKVHIFKTVPYKIDSQKLNGILPIHTLVHDEDGLDYSVCCALFHYGENHMITTGGDASLVTKWAPSNYLNKPLEKTKETEYQPELKTEFKYVSRSCKLGSPNKSYFNNTLSLTPDFKKSNKNRSLRLDSFPNYVIDGMRLPHVVPRIRIKLRNRVAANNWLSSPDNVITKAKAIATDETTPKRRSTRKRRKIDDNLSPKILTFFKVSSSPKMAIATKL